MEAIAQQVRIGVRDLQSRSDHYLESLPISTTLRLTATVARFLVFT